MPLPDIAIRNAKPRQKAYKLCDMQGLFVLVQPSGGKLWRMKNMDKREAALSDLLDPIEHRIAHPFIDGGFPPSGAALGDADLPGERAGLDLPVERRPGQAGAAEHGVKAKNAVGRQIGHHVKFLSYDRSSCCDKPRIETEFLRVKAPKRALLSRIYAWISVENPRHPSFAKNKFRREFDWASQAVSA